MNNLASIRATQIAEEAAEHFSDPATASKLYIPGVRSISSMSSNNNVGYGYDSVEEAFPDVAPGLQPFGDLVMVQIRQPKLRTAGGIELSAEDRKTEHDNTQVARVVAIGPMAFKWQRDGDPWPEGPWCKVGDFVRVPKYQGDRMVRSYERTDFEIDARGNRREFIVRDQVHFVQFKHNALLGLYPDADAALSEKAFF